MVKKKTTGMKYSIWLTDDKCLSIFFLRDSIVVLLTIYAERKL